MLASSLVGGYPLDRPALETTLEANLYETMRTRYVFVSQLRSLNESHNDGLRENLEARRGQMVFMEVENEVEIHYVVLPLRCERYPVGAAARTGTAPIKASDMKGGGEHACVAFAPSRGRVCQM